MSEDEMRAYRPPSARIEMPYQILERRKPVLRHWLDIFRQFVDRRTRQE